MSYGVKFSSVIGLFDPKMGGVEAHCYSKLLEFVKSRGVQKDKNFRISVSRFYKLTGSEFYSIYLLCGEEKYHHAISNFFSDCMKALYVGNLDLRTHQAFVTARGQVDKGLQPGLYGIPEGLRNLLLLWQKALKSLKTEDMENRFHQCIKLYYALCTYDMQFPEAQWVDKKELLRNCLHLVEAKEMSLYSSSLGITNDGLIKKWETNPFTSYQTELTRILKEGFDKVAYS